MLKIFLILIPTSLALDLIWIGGLMGGFYKSQLGDMLRRKGENLDPVWLSALAVYVLIPLGITTFVAGRFVADTTLLQAASWGALFGLVLYGVYDFTNHSLIKGWPLQVVAVDLAWGMVLCASLSVVAWFLRTSI